MLAGGIPRGRFLRVHRAVALAIAVLALPVRLDAQSPPKITRIGLLGMSDRGGSWIPDLASARKGKLPASPLHRQGYGSCAHRRSDRGKDRP